MSGMDSLRKAKTGKMSKGLTWLRGGGRGTAFQVERTAYMDAWRQDREQ